MPVADVPARVICPAAGDRPIEERIELLEAPAGASERRSKIFRTTARYIETQVRLYRTVCYRDSRQSRRELML